MNPEPINLLGLTVTSYERPGTTDQPILFVHGNSSNAHAFELMWNSSALKDFRLLAIDLPGHGNSPKAADAESYRVLNLGRLVAEFIEKKKLQNVFIVGHSVGGHFCIHALEFTNRIAGLLLISTAPLDSGADLTKGYVILPAIMPIFASNISDEQLDNIVPLEVHDLKHQKKVRDSIRMADGRCRETIGQDLGAYFGSPSFVSEISLLSKVGLRVAFAMGEHDKLINPDYFQTLNGFKFWRNKLQLIPGASHCSIFEQPETTAKLVSDWVRNVG